VALLVALLVSWWLLSRGPPVDAAAVPSAAPSAAPAVVATTQATSSGDSAGAPATLAAPGPPPTADERARAAFQRAVRAGELRRQLGEGVPVEVVRLLASGKMREGTRILLQMGRDGDLNGYEALGRLLEACPGWAQDRDFERRADDRRAANERIVSTALGNGVPPAVATRMRWALDAGNAHYRSLWAEFCPGPGQGDYERLRAEVQARVPRPDSRPEEGQQILRRLADAGVLRAQLAVAISDLQRGDAAQRLQAVRSLLALSASSSDAKVELVRCIRRQCVADAGDAGDARSLLIGAARLGHFEALRVLASPAQGSGRREDLELAVGERYAWGQVYDALQADGCFGATRFGTWAHRQRESNTSALMAMSPADAKDAERRARELLAAELPAIRRRIACD